MRRFAINTLGLGMILIVGSACTSGPESTTDASLGQNGSDGVTGGEIIVSGDLAAGTAAPDRGTVDADGPTISTVARATTASSATPSTSAAPRQATANTTSSQTTTATTDAEVVGDGPVRTSPVGNDDSGESPGVGNGLRPAFFALEATTTVECADADPGTVSLRWEVIGAESVDVSIGFVGNIRSPDEPPAGTINLPLDCTAGSQYFVIAENPDGETIRSVTVGAG